MVFSDDLKVEQWMFTVEMKFLQEEFRDMENSLFHLRRSSCLEEIWAKGDSQCEVPKVYSNVIQKVHINLLQNFWSCQNIVSLDSSQAT